jgi:hypothetical protein
LVQENLEPVAERLQDFLKKDDSRTSSPGLIWLADALAINLVFLIYATVYATHPVPHLFGGRIGAQNG